VIVFYLRKVVEKGLPTVTLEMKRLDAGRKNKPSTMTVQERFHYIVIVVYLRIAAEKSLPANHLGSKQFRWGTKPIYCHC